MQVKFEEKRNEKNVINLDDKSTNPSLSQYPSKAFSHEVTPTKMTQGPIRTRRQRKILEIINSKSSVPIPERRKSSKRRRVVFLEEDSE